MKILYKILTISFLSINTFAQQATELDPKFVKLPRYANLTAITAAIQTPTQGMQVYNIATASNWYYNGTAWVNSNNTNGLSLPYSNTSAIANPIFEIINNVNSNLTYDLKENVAIKGVYGGQVFGGFDYQYDKFAGIYGVFNGTGISYILQNNAGGVLGEGLNGANGVLGVSYSNTGSGVNGTSSSGIGVSGYSFSGIGGHFESINGPAANFINETSSFPTVRFKNDVNLGTAIDITGGIKVSGTNKAAFKIVTTATYIAGNKFGILNTTMANAATDILIVTYEYTGGSYLNKQFATFWNGGNWEIHLTDGTAMPTGITFNILVIKQ